MVTWDQVCPKEADKKFYEHIDPQAGLRTDLRAHPHPIDKHHSRQTD